MIQTFTGIKNEVNWTPISCYSFWGSALVKIMQKIARHYIFGAQIESFETKNRHFSATVTYGILKNYLR